MTIGYFEDLKLKELMPVKMMLFLQASGDMALYPFLTLHMKSLGISLVEIGVQFAITPLAVLVATPLIGLLADKIGNFRWMIVISLLFSALVGQLILYVPKIQQVSVCSLEQQRFQFSCPSNRESENEREDFFTLKVPACFDLASHAQQSAGRHVSSGIFNMQFDQCAVVCHNKVLPTHMQRPHPASSDNSSVWWSAPDPQVPSYCLHNEEKNIEHCWTPSWMNGTRLSNELLMKVSLNAAHVPVAAHVHGNHSTSGKDKAANSKPTSKLETLAKNVPQVPQTAGQSPASASSASVIVSATPGVVVKPIPVSKSKDEHNGTSTSVAANKHEDAVHVIQVHGASEPSAHSSGSPQVPPEEMLSSHSSVVPSNANNNHNVIEGLILSIERQSSRAHDDLTTYQTIRCNSEYRQDCHISCAIKANSDLPGMVQQFTEDPFSHHVTFWLYLLLRILLSIIIATEMSMLKAAILTLVDKHNSEYGYQRMWASMSVAIVPLCTGILMDQLIKSGDSSTFSPCFYVFALFKIMMALICMFINLDVKAPSAKVWSKLGKLLQRPEVSLFLFFCGLIGCIWGFIETFIAWFMEELNASRTLIGFNITVAALVGIPFNLFAGRIEKQVGHVPIIIFGIFVYAIRCVGYSFATQAYHVVMFEVLDGITSTLLIVTMTTYASKLSSTDLIATMQAAWAAMHFSVGRSLGSMFGGVLMQTYGPSSTYLIFGFISIFFGTVYILVYVFYLREHIQERIETEKQEKISAVNYMGNQAKIAINSGYHPTGNTGKNSYGLHYGLNNNLEHLANRNLYPDQTKKSNFSAY